MPAVSREQCEAICQVAIAVYTDAAHAQGQRPHNVLLQLPTTWLPRPRSRAHAQTLVAAFGEFAAALSAAAGKPPPRLRIILADVPAATLTLNWREGGQQAYVLGLAMGTP